MGGTMRLGARVTKFTHTHANGEMSTLQRMYGKKEEVLERHRHRYEVNPDVVESIHNAGLLFVGRDETGTRMEVAELPRSEHPYYIGCQYHPEFQSRPLAPSPPFHGLVLAACGMLDDYLSGRQKLAIARIFLKKPPVMIMDEATSGLDNDSQARIQDLLETQWKGKSTLIAVVHRLDIIKNYDRVGVMKGGKIIEMGTYDELMDKQGVLRELVDGKK